MERAGGILAVIGPTASGKSAVAMHAARLLGAEILSVDSMCVYRGLDIGAAKPSAADQREIRHHLVDVVEANEVFTAARFAELAKSAVEGAALRGAPVVAVGGSPLYFKALFQGMFEGPSADAALREKLLAEGNAALHARLAQVDPESAGRIHVNDSKRLVRAMEVFELTGKPISSLQTEWEAPEAKLRATWVGLAMEKEPLNRRINARTRQMIESGWVEETRGLLNRFGALSKTAGEATGYGVVAEHLAGRLTLEDAVEQVKIATRQLARKQMKWFRRFADVHWLEAMRDPRSIAEEAVRLFERDRSADAPVTGQPAP